MSLSPSSSSGHLLISDRPLDTIFDRLPSVFVPSYVGTLGNLTDVVRAYDDLERQSYADEQFTRVPEEHIDQFTQQQHQPWRFFYLDLDRLSRELQTLHQLMLHHGSPSTVDQQQTSFIRTLDAELAKVNDFYSLKLGEIQRRVSLCHSQSETKVVRLGAEINTMLPNEIVQLAHFAKSNNCALFAVLARYDSQVLSLQRKRQPLLQNQLYRLVSSKLFYQPSDLSELISSLNKLHKICRCAPSSLPMHESLISLPAATSPDDESRQVPDFTTIYISPTPADETNSSYLPPSPATSSDDDEQSMYTTSSVTSADSCITSGSADVEQQQQQHGVLSVQQFWIHPDNLVEIMLHVGKYLDIQSEATLPQAQTDTSTTVGNGSSHSHTITTLHLDTPQLTSYTERTVANDNGKPCVSTALRMRWSGQDHGGRKPVVALEEKVYYSADSHISGRQQQRRRGHKSLGKSPYLPTTTSHHHASTSPRKSKRHIGSKSYIKHRVWFKSKHMDPWLSGNWSIQHVLCKAECKHWRLSRQDTGIDQQILAVEENARACHMEPVLKTMLNRTVYTDPSSELVVTIDTEIAMARPVNDPQAGTDEHCYASSGSDDYFMRRQSFHKSSFKSNDVYPYASLAPNDVVRFPFCVLKVSGISSLQGRPSWLADLCSSPLVEAVHDFSVYLHGVSVLMPHRVHVFPGWLSKLSVDLSCSGDRGVLINPLQRDTLTVDMQANNSSQLQLPATPWSTSSAVVTLGAKSSISSSNSSSSSISSSNGHRRPRPSSADEKKDERTPLLKRKHDTLESYCSFDHPSSSRSDPSTCRDCHARRRQSSSYSNRSGRSSASMRSLFGNADRNVSPLLLTYLGHFIRSLWPAVPHPHGPILPTTTTTTADALPQLMPMSSERRSLKVIVICSIISTSLVFLFYYSLSTL